MSLEWPVSNWRRVAEPRKKNGRADVAAAAGRKVIGSAAGRRKKPRSAHGERRTKDGDGAPWRCGERRGHNSSADVTRRQ